MPVETEPHWELYDLREDEAEMRNVIDDPELADVVADLKRQLFALRERIGDTDTEHPRLLERLQDAG